NDIGCGMALLPTRLHRDDLLAARDDIMGRIQSTIPAGMGAHRDARPGGDVDGLLNAAFDAMEEASAACGIPLSTSQAAFVKQGDRPLTRHAFVERGRSQA